MNLEIKNKVALITGASQEIGYAALAFAREGTHSSTITVDGGKSQFPF